MKKVEGEEIRKIQEVPQTEPVRIITKSGKVQSRVYLRGQFDHSEGRYYLQSWDDCSAGRYVKKDQLVFVGFTF